MTNISTLKESSECERHPIKNVCIKIVNVIRNRNNLQIGFFNYSLDHGHHEGQNQKSSHVTPLKSSDFDMLQSTSSNPTLGTAVLTSNNSSEVLVSSTTLDDQPMLEITSSNGSKSAVVSSVVNNDIYTLTLTDGSIVQLRVTNEGQQSQQNSQGY
jgi:hypothetical protein